MRYFRECAGLLFAFALGATPPAFAVGRELPLSASWPQTHSDIAPDPGMLFGVLPNGMRYAIKRNATPTHQVSLRLRIEAGSLDETNSEEGIAHFLEHMAFRGSKHLPDGRALKVLEGMGLSLQTDLNATTTPNETVFIFDLPANDKTTIGKGLLLTREIASELTLSPKAIDSERAVVLAEARQRDIPAMHMQKADLTASLGERLANALTPIGKDATIRNASPSLLRKFYNSYYRPDRATLLVIGDIDPKAIEQEIKTKFSNWKAAAPEPQPPVYSVTPQETPRFKIFSEPGANSAVSLSWVVPHDTTPDSVTREQRDIVRLIGLTILNQRLQSLAQSDKAPFVAAAAQWAPVAQIADVTEIDATYRPGGAMDAVRAIRTAYNDILRNGVRQEEVNEATSRLHAFFQNQAAAATSTPSPKLATALLRTIGRNDVITAPGQDLALFESSVANLDAASVNAALKNLFATVAPAVFVSSPTPVEGGEAGIVAIFAQSAAQRTEQPAPNAPAASTATDWPYTSFGTAGAVTSRKTIADLGTTFVTFSNGVRATIKPTEFRKGQIVVSVRFGEGRLGLPKDRKSPVWALNGALVLGGLNRIDLNAMQKALAGKVVGVALQTEDDAFDLAGQTRPEDFDTELQLLAAYATDPAWRPQGLLRAQSAMVDALTQLTASPDGVFKLQYESIAHNGDPRWTPPTEAEVRAVRLDEVKSVLQSALASEPMEIIVTGDISVDDAVKGLQATFGALPARPLRTAALSGDEHLQAQHDSPIVLRHAGNDGQALAMIAWPTMGEFPDMQKARTLRILEQIVSLRLFDELRTHEGLTYTPQTLSEASQFTPTFGYVSAFADIPPARIADFYSAVAKVVGDLKIKPVSDGELERARETRVQDVEHKQQTNEYWAEVFRDAQSNPMNLDLIRSAVSGFQRVTAADIQHAAQTYLLDEKAWKTIIVPRGYRTSAVSGSDKPL